jgi:hypothetical protein
MAWFEVDKDGLRQLFDGRDKAFVIRELVQNCVDEPGVTFVDVMIAQAEDKGRAKIKVVDNAPEGFYDLRHAYTLYARTRKRPDPEKRGRFNLGEKQILSICEEAMIITTKGTVEFRRDGTRHKTGGKTKSGSIFYATVRMTKSDIRDAVKAAKTFILPDGIEFKVNGRTITHGAPLKTITAKLTTEHEGADGQWKRTQRKTKVEIYEPRLGEKPMLYELGLPVVELEGGDPWHVNVLQRVPLNSDRDNVSPAFIRDVRAEVLNKLADSLSDEQAAESWVSDATDDERVDAEAVRTVVNKRFGDYAVVADPSDPQSRERAIMAGYTIVPARSFSSDTWRNVRSSGALKSSSQVFGTPEKDVERMPDSDLTEDMRSVAEIVHKIDREVWKTGVEVAFHKALGNVMAEWQHGTPPTISFNVRRLGKKWFEPRNLDAQVELIVHELGHYRGTHLDHAYIDALCEIAGRLFVLDRQEVLGRLNVFA